MTTTIRLPVRPHARQLEIIRSTARFNVIAAGRRFGKTEAVKIRAAYRAPRQRVWWVMPTHDSGQEIWRDFELMFSGVPGAYINRSERLIRFSKHQFLQVKSGDSKLRSAGLDHVVVDEAAFCDPELWSFVLRPMLLEARGSADFLSSTNGRNWFWDVYQLGLDPLQPDWRAFHYTSYDNPLISREEIDDIKRTTPQRVFEQEYLAVFHEDGGAVFRNINACIQPEPAQARRVVFGIDLGRTNDYSVIVAIDADSGRMVAMDRFTEIAWDIQALRIQAMAERYRPDVIVMEENFNDSFVERLQSAGLPIQAFRTTSTSKQQIINQLALAFEQGEIGILNDPVLIRELQAFSAEKLPGGALRYGAPRGMHDDAVMALALAWDGLRRAVPISVTENVFY